MAFTQGDPLPNITQTTTTADTAPKYYTDYLSNLADVAKTATGKTAAESVAGYDPLQTQGYGALPGAVTAGASGLDAAGLTAAEAAKGIQPDRIQALMNPYTQNVVDEMARLSQQNMQQNLLPGMKAGFVGTGGLGSQRYANALGQSMADTQSSLTGQQYGALSKGYSEALKGALDEATLRNNAALAQQKIADAEQLQGITGAQALTKAGAERQGYEQSLLDAPLKTATTASNLLKGYTQPQTRTETFVGPKAGLYQLSDLEKVAGTLSTLGGIASGSGLNTIQSAGTSLGNYLKGLISGNTGITGGLTIDPDEFAGQNAAGTPVYYDTTTGQYYDTSGNIIPISGGEGE
jgi:hypothetical protein